MEANVLSAVTIASTGLEIGGVLVITMAFLLGAGRGVFLLSQKREGVFELFKMYIGRALQVGLEFLVAADIIRTVSIEPSIKNIMSLGLLIIVRTFLSWSIQVELQGCWPWQAAKIRE